MQTEVPGNYTSPTQPFPTGPEPLDRDRAQRDHRRVHHGLHARVEAAGGRDPEQVPARRTRMCRRSPTRTTTPSSNNVRCVGGLNIYHPPVADPATGMMYAPHAFAAAALRRTSSRQTAWMSRATEFAGKSEEAWRGRDRVTPTTGTTVAAYKQGGPNDRPRCRRSTGCRSTSRSIRHSPRYDMNTGEKLWDLPVGQTPDRDQKSSAAERRERSEHRRNRSTRFRW